MLERIYQDDMEMRMVLIRVMATERGHQKWLALESTILNLMEGPFGYDGRPISVYSTIIGSEETRAIAAHYLTLSRSTYHTVWALRIEQSDLDNIGMRIRETPGDTGVFDIDTKHRDIIGDRETFELLTAHLYDRIRHGEDRLRVVGPIQLKHQIQDFLNADSGIVSEGASARCRQLLQ